MSTIENIASEASFIVNGYSFTKDANRIRVLNLNRPDRAAVLSFSGELLETSMDDIELGIVQGYFETNRIFLED